MLDEHLSYISDRRRLALFDRALLEVLSGDERVADLGCGTGILGLMCLQRGARWVEAIDETSMIEVAREAFRRASHGDRVRLHHDSTFRVKLDTPVDVLICDHVGYFGIDYGLLGLLSDARRRLLKPNGKIVPSRLQLLLGAVESDQGRSKVEAWTSESVPPTFHWLRDRCVNAKHPIKLRSEDMLSGMIQLADFDLGADCPVVHKWQVQLEISRDGWLDGLAGCFRAQLSPSVWMSNSPMDEEPIARQQAFLPIDARVRVHRGDRVDVTIRQVPMEHLIAWTVIHHPSGRRFSHSTFAGQLRTAKDLGRLRVDRRPRLNQAGSARRIVLGYVDGQLTAEEIFRAVLRDHPELFPSIEEIERFVGSTLSRDTE